MSLSVAVVVARFNAEITEGLLAGARETLRVAGVDESAITVVYVPGAFELPLAAQRLAETGRYAAVVCLGCLIKGDTMHFEYIAEATAHGLMRVMLDSGVPVAFGVLTTLTDEQAEVRAMPGEANKGAEAARAALDMVKVVASLPPSARVARR